MATYREIKCGFSEGRPRTSVAWEHFEIKDKKDCVATCNICQDSFSYRTSVSNLLKHLRAKHGFVPEPKLNNDPDSDVDDKRHHQICELLEGGAGGSSGNEGDTKQDKRKLLKSEIWQYFEVKDDINRLATCNICNAELSYKTTTTNLKRHVRTTHGVEFSKSDDETEEERSEEEVGEEEVKTASGHPSRVQRSVVWLYFKLVDAEAKLSKCLICKKLLSHSSTVTNLKKHLSRKHPNLKIPGKSDGSKRILLSAGGELYEVEKQENGEEIEADQNETLEMDTVFIEDFEDNVEKPKTHSKRKRNMKTRSQRKKNKVENANFKWSNSSSSSDEELPFHSSSEVKKDSFDCFGKYIASLLRNLPKTVSNELQMEFVKQAMAAQPLSQVDAIPATAGNCYSTDSLSHAYSITVTGEPQDYVPVSDK